MPDDAGSPFDELDPPPPSRLLAVGALVGGALMVAAVAVVWGALTIAYGAEPFPWIAVIIVTAIPALLLAIGMDMVLRAFRGSTPGYWPIAAVTYVLVLVAMVALLKAADTEYAAETARMESACSAADTSLLTAPVFAPGPWATEPAGDRQGSCFITVTLSDSQDHYLAELADGLAAAKWSVVRDKLPDEFTATNAGVTVVGRRGPTNAQGTSTVDVLIPAQTDQSVTGG